jgi:acyl-CoA synthetase (AMP-forming)/AMP-acid ligase II
MVAAVAVRAFEDEQSTPLLAAYVVIAPGAVMEPATLRGFAQMHLPPYMVPSVFLQIEAFPQTVGGKLNRAALPDPLPLWRAGQRDDGS